MFEDFSQIFFDRVQFMRYDPRQKFDAVTRGILAIFKIWLTISCCKGVKGLKTIIRRFGELRKF
jgi:hypothetical protein